MSTIKVTNIPRWISELHLKQYFSGCGTIVRARVALDSATLRQLGYGYVTFADQLGAERALSKDGMLLDGSQINVALDSEVQVEEEAMA